MFIALFFKYMLNGMTIALPLGPISIMCISSSLSHGKKGTFAVTLGSGIIHALYASIALLSIQGITTFITQYRMFFHFIAFILLAKMAYSTFFASKTIQHNDHDKQTDNMFKFGRKAFDVACFALANPMTIFGFMALLSTSETQATPLQAYEIAWCVLAICTGSTLWRLTVGLGSLWVKEQFNSPDKLHTMVQYFSSTMLTIYACHHAISGLKLLSI